MCALCAHVFIVMCRSVATVWHHPIKTCRHGRHSYMLKMLGLPKPEEMTGESIII